MSTPDLQAVLATLAQFSQPQQAAHTTFSQLQPSHNFEHSRRLLHTDASQSARPTIDPATIITWQEGLRCVTKIAAQNRNFEEILRKMIRDQRAHEMRWYSERQKLKQTQANRSKSSAQAMSILQSLGNAADQSSETLRSQPNAETELAAFDMTIWQTQKDMQSAMTLELKALGVPFFGTKPSLVRSESETIETTSAEHVQQRCSQFITPIELLELQRRMVRHLEDLYRD